MSFDYINASFELLGGILCWLNVRQVLKDRAVKGVSWPAIAFFSIWGVWNLIYYPALGQWASFWGGIFLVSGNTTWVILLIRFSKKGKS